MEFSQSYHWREQDYLMRQMKSFLEALVESLTTKVDKTIPLTFFDELSVKFLKYPVNFFVGKDIHYIKNLFQKQNNPNGMKILARILYEVGKQVASNDTSCLKKALSIYESLPLEFEININESKPITDSNTSIMGDIKLILNSYE